MQGNSPRQITKKLRQGKLRLNWYTVDNMQHIKRWRESRKCITGDCDMRQSTRCDVCSVHSTNRVCHTQNNTSGLLKTEQLRFDWEAYTGDQNCCVKEIRHTKERKGKEIIRLLQELRIYLRLMNREQYIIRTWKQPVSPLKMWQGTNLWEMTLTD